MSSAKKMVSRMKEVEAQKVLRNSALSWALVSQSTWRTDAEQSVPSVSGGNFRHRMPRRGSAVRSRHIPFG